MHTRVEFTIAAVRHTPEEFTIATVRHTPEEFTIAAVNQSRVHHSSSKAHTRVESGYTRVRFTEETQDKRE